MSVRALKRDPLVVWNLDPRRYESDDRYRDAVDRLLVVIPHARVAGATVQEVDGVRKVCALAMLDERGDFYRDHLGRVAYAERSAEIDPGTRLP